METPVRDIAARLRHASLLVLLGLACPAAFAQSTVTVYGRLNTALEYARASTATDGTALAAPPA